MHAYPAVNPWHIEEAARVRGGSVVVPRHAAPLGLVLPYRRAAGQAPPSGETELRLEGWTADLGARGLGDMLLGLGLAKALSDATGAGAELRYRGPRKALMDRCDLPLIAEVASGGHLIVHKRGGQCWTAIPEQPPTRLDLLDDGLVEVHAALGMRYYLTVEQRLGVRLPSDRAPLPAFTSTQRRLPGHVVFIAATSRPDRKDYGTERFARLARTLADRAPEPSSFTLVTGTDHADIHLDGIEVQTGLDAVDCVDLFASAALVVGNDTGLTHLAALTRDAGGCGPEVIGLYGRHAHNKWTTGVNRHHAVASPFSQMLAAADRCPVRDDLDDSTWGEAARLDRLQPAAIADFAAEILGWRAP